MRIRPQVHVFVRLFLRLIFRLFPPAMGADFSRPTRALAPIGRVTERTSSMSPNTGDTDEVSLRADRNREKISIVFAPKNIMKSMYYRK